MSDMKCPFCGEKIEHIEDGWCNCKNRCTGSGSIELWLQFLRTRKQLEMANAELDYIKEQIEKNGAFDNTRKALDVAKERLKNIILDAETLATPEYLASRARETLDEITALEQKDVK
ncbi:MAG: hypothetical protein ACLRFP_00505 [Alphaproteobacteria bacterium]